MPRRLRAFELDKLREWRENHQAAGPKCEPHGVLMNVRLTVGAAGPIAQCACCGSSYVKIATSTMPANPYCHQCRPAPTTEGENHG